jgi:hypothetical protein
MWEVFRFYMPGRWSKPVFSSNSAAAQMWTLAVLGSGSLIACVALLCEHRHQEGAVFAGIAGVFFVAGRTRLSAAAKVMQMDKIVRGHLEGGEG